MLTKSFFLLRNPPLFGEHEILLFITTAIVAEVENRTFRETSFAAELEKCFMRPIMLHGAMLAETDFSAPINMSFTRL